MKYPKLNLLANQIHIANLKAGWWDDFLPEKHTRHETAMALVLSEIMEGLEGIRKGINDDHLPQYQMFDVEMADAMVRLLDLAGAYEINLDCPITGIVGVGNTLEDEIRDRATLNPMAGIYKAVQFILGGGQRPSVVMDNRYRVKKAIVAVVTLYEAYGTHPNMFEIVVVKVAYNAQRADHKKSAREAKGGKKW